MRLSLTMTYFILLVVALVPASAEQAPCNLEWYSEDFEADAGYASTDSTNVYQDSLAGYGWCYYANTIDGPPWPAFYCGYSPEFSVVTGDFTIQFDFMIVTPDWGCYPGVSFVNTTVPDTSAHDGIHEAFKCNYSWSDHVHKRFRLVNHNTEGEEYITPQSPTAERWYRITLSYDAANSEVDWLVEDIGDSVATVFYELVDAVLTVTEGFNQVRIGDIQMPPEYGDESDIRVDNIRIWSYGEPLITSIEDVPNDQGRQVSVTWERSWYDQPGSTMPVTEYAVFRRIDDVSISGDRAAWGVPGGGALYPPGDWHYIGVVPAMGEYDYSLVAPTLADSTISEGMHYSVFFVRPLTDEVGQYCDSAPDSGYSIDNLAPYLPDGGGSVSFESNGNLLTWDECEEADFQYYRVYAGSTPDFEPAPETQIGETLDTEWLDEGAPAWEVFYRVAAVDFAGNEGNSVLLGSATGADDSAIPARLAVYQNTPNPFNPVTSIAYDVPAGVDEVTIRVFDVNGRRVTTLVEGLVPPGRHVAVWDGTNQSGQSVASGVYYYTLEAAGQTTSRKMLLMK